MKVSQIFGWLGAVAVIGLAAFALTAKFPTPVTIKVDLPPLSTSPKAFLTGLYSHYAGSPTTFSPLGEASSLYFDPEMVELMAEDKRLSGDEVGALDGDPICGCQDFGKLKADIKVTSADSIQAQAVVTVIETDPAFGKTAPRQFTYDLRQVNGAWRIHDIHDATTPSLRQLFIASNKDLGASASSAGA